MEIRELRYFVQIAKDHSYTHAAEHLYISQPALSKTMKKIEKEFGVTLFITKNNVVNLTEYGKCLYDKAVLILKEFQGISNIVKDTQAEQSGKITIGITPMIGTLWIIDMVVDFCNLYPKVDIKIIDGGSKFIHQELIKGNIDLGICLKGGVQENLEETFLFSSKMIVCTSANNPLAGNENISVGELKDETFNFYGDSSFLSKMIMDRCINAGFKPKINFSTSKVDLIMQFTSRGKGICIIPKPYADRYAMLKLKQIPIAEDFPWTGCLVKNKQMYQSYVCKLFEQYILSKFTMLQEKDSKMDK